MDKSTYLLYAVMSKLEFINEFTASGICVDDIDVDSCKEAVQAILSDKDLQIWWREQKKETDNDWHYQ